MARGDILGLTDDDCEVSPEWTRALVDTFENEPSLGAVFGGVLPGSHDSSAGFIPASICRVPKTIHRVRDVHRIGGMGACLGIRRNVWTRLGGFDERLGTGTRIGAGEEIDFIVRTLLAGHSVGQTPAFEVVHHGFRTWDQGRTLIQSYWRGAGATYGIHATSSPWSVGQLLAALGLGWISGRSAIAESLGPDPHRLMRLTAFAKGLLLGLPLRPWRGTS